MTSLSCDLSCDWSCDLRAVQLIEEEDNSDTQQRGQNTHKLVCHSRSAGTSVHQESRHISRKHYSQSRSVREGSERAQCTTGDTPSHCLESWHTDVEKGTPAYCHICQCGASNEPIHLLEVRVQVKGYRHTSQRNTVGPPCRRCDLDSCWFGRHSVWNIFR